MKTPDELFTECNITLQYNCGVFKGRPIRFFSDTGALQIGDDNFDRWANSVETEFDLWSAKGQRAFLRWVKS